MIISSWRGVLLSVALTVFGVLDPGQAHAASVLDQSFEPDSFGLRAVINGHISHAQTFTVGVTGILDRIELTVGLNPNTGFVPDQDLIVEVQQVSQGFPDGRVIATLAVPPERLPQTNLAQPSIPFSAFDFRTQAIPVRQGDVLAIVLSSPGSDTNTITGPYLWSGTGRDLYPSGQHVARIFPGPWMVFQAPGSEVGFRVFVDIEAAPIPFSIPALLIGALLLMGAGLFGLRPARRWR